MLDTRTAATTSAACCATPTGPLPGNTKVARPAGQMASDTKTEAT
jgi:hypothetical protein